MNIEKLDETEKNSNNNFGSDKPKHKQFIKMLTFRVVPAYYKEIEKVAKNKGETVSKLIRSYIKEGMIRDKEISNQEGGEFEVEPTKPNRTND
jgi:hypothetical protein